MVAKLENYTTIGSIVNIIKRTLEDYGVDINPLLNSCGIDVKAISNPESRVSVKRMQTLWKLSVEACKDPCFGFNAGLNIQPSALHGLGFAWLASDTLRDALERLVKYSSLLSSFSENRLHRGETGTELIFSGTNNIANFVYATEDFYVTAIIKMCNITSTDQLQPRHIQLTRPQPPGELKNKYARFAQCRLSFGRENISIVFDNKTLDKPLSSPNSKLARINDQIVEQYLSQFLSSSISQRVRESIINYLPDGSSNIDDIAESLKMSRRSLHRKLKEDNCSFRSLTNDIKRDLAVEYLQQSSRSLAEVSYLLGFSNQANFSRAFIRWFDVSPTNYRLQYIKAN